MKFDNARSGFSSDTTVVAKLKGFLRIHRPILIAGFAACLFMVVGAFPSTAMAWVTTSVNITIKGSGTVTSNPANVLTCPGSTYCAMEIPGGTTAVLTAEIGRAHV